jgi:hypothetical protein
MRATTSPPGVSSAVPTSSETGGAGDRISATPVRASSKAVTTSRFFTVVAKLAWLF